MMFSKNSALSKYLLLSIVLIVNTCAVFGQEISPGQAQTLPHHQIIFHLFPTQLGLSYTIPITQKFNPRALVTSLPSIGGGLGNICPMISSRETYIYNYIGVEASRNDGGAVLGLGLIHYISQHFIVQFESNFIFRVGLLRSSEDERSLKDGILLRGGLGYAF